MHNHWEWLPHPLLLHPHRDDWAQFPALSLGTHCTPRPQQCFKSLIWETITQMIGHVAVGCNTLVSWQSHVQHAWKNFDDGNNGERALCPNSLLAVASEEAQIAYTPQHPDRNLIHDSTHKTPSPWRCKYNGSQGGCSAKRSVVA